MKIKDKINLLLLETEAVKHTIRDLTKDEQMTDFHNHPKVQEYYKKVMPATYGGIAGGVAGTIGVTHGLSKGFDFGDGIITTAGAGLLWNMANTLSKHNNPTHEVVAEIISKRKKK